MGERSETANLNATQISNKDMIHDCPNCWFRNELWGMISNLEARSLVLLHIMDNDVVEELELVPRRVHCCYSYSIALIIWFKFQCRSIYLIILINENRRSGDDVLRNIPHQCLIRFDPVMLRAQEVKDFDRLAIPHVS